MIFVVVWAVLFWLAGLYTSTFWMLSVAMIPIAIYEIIRTEGKKNTKPLSALTLGVLILQLLHVTKIFLLPIDVSFLLDILPVSVPSDVDQIIFLSIILLLIFSILLIKYTWGSVTKLLAILLLVGSLIQAYMYWSVFEDIINSNEGQQLIQSQEENIKKNLQYRLEQELN